MLHDCRLKYIIVTLLSNDLCPVFSLKSGFESTPQRRFLYSREKYNVSKFFLPYFLHPLFGELLWNLTSRFLPRIIYGLQIHWGRTCVTIWSCGIGLPIIKEMADGFEKSKKKSLDQVGRNALYGIIHIQCVHLKGRWWHAIWPSITRWQDECLFI